MLAETLENFHINNIFILQPIKNNLIMDGLFYKLLYSDNLYISNGIYIDVNLIDITYVHGKIIYDISKNLHIIKKISAIEKYIFQHILNPENNKKKLYYKISDQFYSGQLKLNNFNNNNNNNFILKISGVWENLNSLGISFKLIHINRVITF